MSIPTTDDLTEGLTEAEDERMLAIMAALDGMDSGRAVALLMSVICLVADQDPRPADLWRAIRTGAKEELRLLGKRGPVQ